MWVQNHLVGVMDRVGGLVCLQHCRGGESSLLEKEAALAVTAEDSLQEGYDPQQAGRTEWHRSVDSSRDVAKDPVSARASPVANTWQM